MMPTPMMLDTNRIRLFIGSCDVNMIGRVGYIDLNAHDATQVLHVASQPVLDVGQSGAFDDNGVVPSCVVRVNDEIRLYYVGFQLGFNVRYFMFAGLAISRDEGASFERVQSTPVLERRDGEILVRTAPFVHGANGNWRCFYAGGDRFIDVDGKRMPTYILRTTLSSDGVVWAEASDQILDFVDTAEYGFGRPWVVRTSDTFEMWFSVRTRQRGYRLGYATSVDGRHWHRTAANAGIDVSDSGWDSKMLCYASILKTEHHTYMFYNGNDHGGTGVGVAVLEE